MRFVDKMTVVAEPIIENLGCELVDAEYVKEGPRMVLRFYVEKREGHISLDDCAAVSEAISAAIDARTDDGNGFVMEVSSPGVERVLKSEREMAHYIGSEVDVSLYEPVNGEKKFVCVLGEKRGGEYLFIRNGEEMRIPAEKIGKINLHFDFD